MFVSFTESHWDHTNKEYLSSIYSCLIYPITHTVTFCLKLLVLYLGFAYSFDLWGSSLLLLLVLLLQLLLSEHLQVGWSEGLPLW